MKRPVQLIARVLALTLAISISASVPHSLARQAEEGTTVHFQLIPGQPDFVYFDNDYELNSDEYCLPVAINGKSLDGKDKQAIEKLLGQTAPGNTLNLTYINKHGLIKTIELKAPLLKSFYPEAANLEALQSEFKKVDQYPISQRSPVNYKEDEFLSNQWDLFVQAGVNEMMDTVIELPVDFRSCQNQAAALAAASCLRCGDLTGADKYTGAILSTLDYDHVINFYTGSQNKLIPLLIATNRLETASTICQTLLRQNLSPELLDTLDLTEYKSGAYKSAINTFAHADSASRLYPLLNYYAQILERQNSPKLAAVADCMYAIRREYSTPAREDNALLGDLYYRLGKFDKALEIYNEDLIQSQYGDINKLDMVGALYYCHSALRVANVYNKLDKQAKAISTLESAIAYRKKLFSQTLEENISHNASYFPRLADLEKALTTIKSTGSDSSSELSVDGPDKIYSYGYKNKLLMRYGQAIANVNIAIKAKDSAQIEKTIGTVKQYLSTYKAEEIDYLSMDLPCAIIALARNLSDAGYIAESNSLLNYLLSKPSTISATAPYLIRVELSINQYRKDKTLPDQIGGKTNSETPLLTGALGYRYMGALYLAAGQMERADITLNHANKLLKAIDWSNLPANKNDQQSSPVTEAGNRVAVLLDLARLEQLRWHQDKDASHLTNVTNLVDEAISFIKMLKTEMVPVSTSSYTNTAIIKTYCLANALRRSGKTSQAVAILGKIQPLVCPVFTSSQPPTSFEPIYLFSKLRCRLALEKGDQQTAFKEAMECQTLRGRNGDASAPLLEALCGNFGNQHLIACHKWLDMVNSSLHPLQGDTKEIMIYSYRQALKQGIQTSETPGILIRQILRNLGDQLVDNEPKEALYYFERALVSADQFDKQLIEREIASIKDRIQRDSEISNQAK